MKHEKINEEELPILLSTVQVVVRGDLQKTSKKLFPLDFIFSLRLLFLLLGNDRRLVSWRIVGWVISLHVLYF